MGFPAAKQGDTVLAVDIHMIQPPGSSPPIPIPHMFSGTVDSGLSTDVKIMGAPAAIVGSICTNSQSHVPTGGTFVKEPTNNGIIVMGSATVLINKKPAARSSDTVATCSDVGPPGGKIVALGTVMIG